MVWEPDWVGSRFADCCRTTGVSSKEVVMLREYEVAHVLRFSAVSVK